MPVQNDNPLRLARIRADIPLSKLAEAVGANRSTLVAIEEGRTKSPSRALLWELDNALSLPAGTLDGQLQFWHRHRDPLGMLTARARAVLAEPPAAVARYRSFVHWRRELAASPTAFASLLGVDRAKVAEYENGVRVNGMPDTLASALVNRLGISNAYLVELAKLEPNDE